MFLDGQLLIVEFVQQKIINELNVERRICVNFLLIVSIDEQTNEGERDGSKSLRRLTLNCSQLFPINNGWRHCSRWIKEKARRRMQRQIGQLFVIVHRDLIELNSHHYHWSTTKGIIAWNKRRTIYSTRTNTFNDERSFEKMRNWRFDVTFSSSGWARSSGRLIGWSHSHHAWVKQGDIKKNLVAFLLSFDHLIEHNSPVDWLF